MCKVDQEKEELLLLEYIKNFKMHYKLLLRRYRRYKEIYLIDNTDIDQITYFDMIIVQLRAMCIESPGLKDNFTVQNLFHRLGKEELVEKIDNMLDESLIGDGDFTIASIEKWQIEQWEPGEITIYVIKADSYSEKDEEEVRAAFANITGIATKFNYVESIKLTERGKSKLLIQHLQL